jgi:hypothetical protein
VRGTRGEFIYGETHKDTSGFLREKAEFYLDVGLEEGDKEKSGIKSYIY